MCRARVTIDAAVLSPAIGIEACLETDIGAAVSSDDRFGSVAKILRGAALLLLGTNITIYNIYVGQIQMQFLESVCRAP